jgi:hypothetical protein
MDCGLEMLAAWSFNEVQRAEGLKNKKVDALSIK